MLLDDVALYLQSQGYGTIGVDLFEGMLPDTPDNVIALLEYSGASPAFNHSSPGIAWERPRFQVVTRGSAYEYTTPRVVAQQVYEELASVVNMVLNGKRYLRITPIQSPFLMRRDENQRVLFAFNCQAEKAI